MLKNENIVSDKVTVCTIKEGLLAQMEDTINEYM